MVTGANAFFQKGDSQDWKARKDRSGKQRQNVRGKNEVNEGDTVRAEAERGGFYIGDRQKTVDPWGV